MQQNLIHFNPALTPEITNTKKNRNFQCSLSLVELETNGKMKICSISTTPEIPIDKNIEEKTFFLPQL